MKKKRITALLLALFMVFNDTVHPFGAENTVVEENTEGNQSAGRCWR